MNQEKLKRYKNKLDRERILLLAEIKRNETPVDFGSDTDDESDETENFGNQLAIVHGLKNRFNEIDIALNKIQSEKYGVCEKCGGEIEEEVLDTDPESRYCKTCKLNESH
jgi:DnaK suppressor protein